MIFRSKVNRGNKTFNLLFYFASSHLTLIFGIMLYVSFLNIFFPPDSVKSRDLFASPSSHSVTHCCVWYRALFPAMLEQPTYCDPDVTPLKTFLGFLWRKLYGSSS
ncbi:hypothetical protein Ancab_034314 [Ancistrocladus abbreviatus]